MANPTKYTPGFSYSGFEASNPGRPKPGAQLDNDFAKIEDSIGETVDALADVRRSDGALKNGIVTTDALADAAVTGAKLDPAVLADIAAVEASASTAAASAAASAAILQSMALNEVHSFVVETAGAVFPLAFDPGNHKLLLTVNGVVQTHGVHYTVDGDEVTFSEALRVGDRVTYLVPRPIPFDPNLNRLITLPSRAALVSNIAEYGAIDGETYFDGEVFYLGQSGATDIVDLPGLVLRLDVLTVAEAAATAAVQTGLDADATEADRLLAESARALAESARDAAQGYAGDAANASDYFDTIALGRAAVADGESFGVIAGGSDGLLYPTIYRRDSSSTQTKIREAITSALLDDRAAEATYAAGAGRYSVTVPASGYAPLAVDTNGGALVLGLTQAQIEANEEALYRAGLGRYLISFSGEPTEAPLVLAQNGDMLLSAAGGSGSGSPAEAVWRVITDDGQSNAEAQAGASKSVVYGSNTIPRLLTLRRGTEGDQWLGMATTGGSSIELVAAEITSIGPLEPQIASTNTHGTGAAEAAARALLARGGSPTLVWSNAEGGQSITNLLPSPPDGYYAFTNIVTALTRAQALRPSGSRLVYDWLLMDQGESDTGNSALGSLHEDYRAAVEAQAQSILGQYEAVRMITWQPSSPTGSWVAYDSLLAWALSHADDGLYICGGPTYGYPWSSDYVHQSSLGHAMRGEAAAAIMRRVDADGRYLPVHAVSAVVTGADQITLTMSEAIEIATDAYVAAITNHGLTLTGGTISAITVSGVQIIITTAGAASGVSAVGIARNLQTSPRTEAAIPRSNIRAARPLGSYSWGGRISAWACHQSISVGA